MTPGRSRMGTPRPVVALHCSGADGDQWLPLGESLGIDYRVHTPEHFGCERVGHWAGEHAFGIEDEAQRTIELIDASDHPMHLVGHSYGGGVALYAALQRPNRIASLSLYEPTAFHLLRQMGADGAGAHAEIAAIASQASEWVLAGDYRKGVAHFVNYWNGPGAWKTMSPRVQAKLVRWAPKIPLDFRALMQASAPLSAYAALKCRTVLIRGENAPFPTRLIIEALARAIQLAEVSVASGCGHMGPLTHPLPIAETIASHIRRVDAEDAASGTRGRPPPPCPDDCPISVRARGLVSVS